MTAPIRRHWYGWQTLLVDAATVALAATVGTVDSGDRQVENVIAGMVLVPYALGGPVVHAAHGQWGRAGASLGLRLGAPTVGALGGYLVGSASCARPDTSDVPCAAVGAGLGLLAGGAAAIILDAAVLAYEPEAAPNLALVPVIIADRDRWGAGLSGTF